MSKWCRANGMLLHLHRAGHGTYTRQKTHGVSLPRDRQVVPDARRRPHPRRHRRRQARGRPGHGPRLLRRLPPALQPRPTPRPGCTSTRTGPRCPRVMPVASGGIHAGQMHQLLHYLGEDVILQFGGGTIGHPMGIAAGATANRVAVEAMIQARNEGRDYYSEGPDILVRGGQGLPRAGRRARGLEGHHLRLHVHRHARRHSSRRRPARSRDDAHHAGHVLLPARPHRRADRGADALRAAQRLGDHGRAHRRPAPAQRATGRCGASRCSTSTEDEADVALREVRAAREALPATTT